MQPLTVITGILLVTSAAIAAGLAVVMLLFFILADEHPRVASEFGTLTVSTVIFLVMTMLCGASFLGLVREAPWRWVAQTGMWVGLVLTVMYYLP